jgi:hypothetical protein
MNWVKHPLDLHHPGVLSGASKTICEPTVCLAQTMRLSCTDTNTVSKWTKTRFHVTHVILEFHRVHPKQFLRLWYIWHKPCTYLWIDWIELPIEPRHLGVPSGASKIIFEHVERSSQTMHLLASRLPLLQMKWIKHPLEPRYLGVPSGASKMISEPMLCLAQTVLLSCADTNTFTK